jgi:hypothetical protein
LGTHAGRDATPSSWTRERVPGSLLTSCSRRADMRRHKTASADTERHVARDLVRLVTNLRIRCPKGRGSSNLPSRTALTSADGDPMASRASIPDPVLLTLAHAKDAPATSSANTDAWGLDSSVD